MAELFKEHLSLIKINTLGQSIAQQASNYAEAFDKKAFNEQLHIFALEALASDNKKTTRVEQDNIQYQPCIEDAWQSLSLMQRLRTAAKALYQVMPEVKGADIVVETLKYNDELSGWLSLICCEYIGIHQYLSIEQGLYYLQQITEYFSAEFAIRHFILREPEQTLAILKTWLTHENHHVRRLISEGTRPRLPWGVRLPLFIEQPQLVLPLLFALRDDSEEYVRRSVANHLNDIAKDHPQLVIDTAKQWLLSEELNALSAQQKQCRIKLVRHACRTLFKQGQPEIMALFGYQPADDVHCRLSSQQYKIPFSGEFEFEMILEKTQETENQLMIDYVMHFQKANGKQAAKVFKWLNRHLESSSKESVIKKHSFRKISTRKYYPGMHKIEIMVNGIKKSQIEFELMAP
tara:strand:+ start:2319 stop:3533 length:1215 start_codon:yes stop_codon:yes gene_type:complete